MSNKQKSFLSINELVENIKNKGLIIRDEEKLKDL